MGWCGVESYSGEEIRALWVDHCAVSALKHSVYDITCGHVNSFSSLQIDDRRLSI